MIVYDMILYEWYYMNDIILYDIIWMIIYEWYRLKNVYTSILWVYCLTHPRNPVRQRTIIIYDMVVYDIIVYDMIIYEWC